MSLRLNSFTMVNMKRFIVLCIAILFLANTIVVSAWAHPCQNMSSAPQVSEAQISGADIPPCHKNQIQPSSKDETRGHCTGLCLCIHASICAVNYIPTQASLTPPPMLSRAKLVIHHEYAQSFAYAPPRRPPISII